MDRMQPVVLKERGFDFPESSDRLQSLAQSVHRMFNAKKLSPKIFEMMASYQINADWDIDGRISGGDFQ